MWETRRHKTPSLWQIGCSMCTTGIPDLLAAKVLNKWVRKYLQFYAQKNCLSKPMVQYILWDIILQITRKTCEGEAV